MTITKGDLIPSGTEILVLTAVESLMCDDILEDFVDSTNLVNSEGKNIFPLPTWDVIHPNFAQVFGLKVAEKLGKKAFLMDISRIIPGNNVSTLVRLEGAKVLALSPGTLEARRIMLKAMKPSEPVNEVVEVEDGVDDVIAVVQKPVRVKTSKDNTPQVVEKTEKTTTIQIGEPKKVRKKKGL